MTKAGDKIIAGLQEAVAVAKGEIEPARVHVFPSSSDELIARWRALIPSADKELASCLVEEIESALASQSTRIAELERERDEAIVLPGKSQEYWKASIGGSYTPRVLRKHVAAHPETVSRVLATAPDECADVIAALVWTMCISDQRAEFMAESVITQRARLTAANEALRVGEAALEKCQKCVIPSGDISSLDILDAEAAATAEIATIRAALEWK
jgi:hypothetical protein